MAKIGTEKCMTSIIRSISGIQSLVALDKGMKFKYNSQSFCQYVIPDIQQNMCPSIRRRTLKGIILRLGNATVQNSPLYSGKIESAKVPRVHHPHYSPDPAPRNFFLFGYAKENIRITSFTMNGDRVFAIRHIFSELLEMVLKNGFAN
jgi:hypothetical protein